MYVYLVVFVGVGREWYCLNPGVGIAWALLMHTLARLIDLRNLHTKRCERHERREETNEKTKASVTIMADFSPEFNPQFRRRCKHQKKIAVHINNLVSSEFPNRPNRSAMSFTCTLNCT